MLSGGGLGVCVLALSLLASSFVTSCSSVDAQAKANDEIVEVDTVE